MGASSDFLGVGWGYPLTLEDDGRIGLAYYEESIRQSIWIILGTARGERVMRPDFGCGIHDLVFAVSSADLVGSVANLVSLALLQWEPRIDVLSVHVAAGANAGLTQAPPGVLLISINYRVRATNSRFNLVYPFYLE